jgi:hypothetical protein
MTGLEILLLIAGFTATNLVVIAMILIAPRGGVPVHPEERDFVEADPIPVATTTNAHPVAAER